MASVHNDGDKPNLFCFFYDPEGFRRKRSAGTANKRIAMTICTTIERAATLAKTGRLSNEKAMRLIREAHAQIEESHGKLQANAAQSVIKSSVEEFVKLAGGELEAYTVRTWLDGWLKGKTDASKATIIEYQRIVTMFLKHLGARADRALATLQPVQVEAFKESLKTRVAPTTVNKAVKVLKASFSNAVAKRQLEFSPAEHVEAIGTEESTRRPFKNEELGKLLTAADAEWRTMIVTAFYTGLRLRDCANLTWENVDLLGGTIQIATQKTGRKQAIPIADPLARHLSTLAGDKADAPLCPSLCGKPASSLSASFYELMVTAGLATARDAKKKSTGKGRDARRDVGRISFHSLRHNTTSALKSAGVSDSVTMDIVGHESEAVSRSYTKIDDSSKRAAVNKLPDITGVKK